MKNINFLSLGCVHLPRLEYYFPFSSFFFFFFLPELFTVKPPQHRIQTLSNSTYQEGPGPAEIKGTTLGDPPHTGPPKFRSFEPLELDRSKFQNG